MSKSSVFLDIDPSILEKKLLLPECKNDEEVSFFSERKNEDIPWKPIRPSAGFCVKCRTVEGDKVFVNICHTEHIPAPEDIPDEKLIEILESDEAPNYRVPISIGDLHVEADISGNLCSAYDVAVNTLFFNKICTNELFKTFFLTVSLEGLKEKYSLQINLTEKIPYTILKHRKVLGTLKVHRIQQRPVKKVPKPLIQELSSTSTMKPLITEINSTENSEDFPEPIINTKVEIWKHPTENPKCLIASVPLKAASGKDITLDIGEDRIVLIHPKKQETLLDIFLPINIDQDKSEAFFNYKNQILMMKLPLKMGH